MPVFYSPRVLPCTGGVPGLPPGLEPVRSCSGPLPRFSWRGSRQIPRGRQSGCRRRARLTEWPGAGCFHALNNAARDHIGSISMPFVWYASSFSG
jgi:hypothetical protein